MTGVPGKYGLLMARYTQVTEAFLGLPLHYQDGIARMMQQSGEGYAIYLDKKIDTLSDYNHFCYSALGVVAVEWSKVMLPSACSLQMQ